MGKIAKDHIMSLVKAGISGVPIIGGSIASLISDYVPTHTQNAIERTLVLLGERLGQLEGRIDADAVQKDEFAELFKSCYLIVVRTHRESKLRASSNLIVNILLRKGDPEKLSYTELDHYVHCMENLSSGAIEVLAVVYHIPTRTGGNSIEQIRHNFSDIQLQLTNVEPSLLMGLIRELDAANLLHLPGAPGIPTKDYGNYPIQLTRVGAKFVQYILE